MISHQTNLYISYSFCLGDPFKGACPLVPLQNQAKKGYPEKKQTHTGPIGEFTRRLQEGLRLVPGGGLEARTSTCFEQPREEPPVSEVTAFPHWESLATGARVKFEHIPGRQTYCATADVATGARPGLSACLVVRELFSGFKEKPKNARNKAGSSSSTSPKVLKLASP